MAEKRVLMQLDVRVGVSLSIAEPRSGSDRLWRDTKFKSKRKQDLILG